MSLIKCPACHNDVSDEAHSCPKCGQPLTGEIKQHLSGRHPFTRAGKVTIVLAIVLSFVICWISALRSGGHPIGNASSGYTESLVYRFQGGSDGDDPLGGLIMDRTGTLYGTTQYGGDTNGDGTVFKITPDGTGGYTESVVYRFPGGSNGDDPHGGLVIDRAGALYGTAGGGSSNCPDGCGTVFKLTPDGTGGYSEAALYRFRGGSDGWSPGNGLVRDSADNLYGTTSDGGGIRNCPLYGRECGVVFKLTPDGSGGYTESILYRFRGGSDEWSPETRLIMDGAGNLYGTADGGRSNCPLGIGCGVVFKLAHDGSGGYTESILYRFQGGSDGWAPYGRLTIDHAGNLYGTTGFGGNNSSNRECSHYGCGVVFKLAPDGSDGYTESILYRFQGGSDGSGPESSLIMDDAGSLYGTTVGGGSSKCPDGCGTVFKLTPDGSGGYTESVLYRFRGGSDGSSPDADQILGHAGTLYGTLQLGGKSSGHCSTIGCGFVYKLHVH